MRITQAEDVILIAQDFYVKIIEQIPGDASLSIFESKRMKLAWVANAKLALVFEISWIAQAARVVSLKQIYQKNVNA